MEAAILMVKELDKNAQISSIFCSAYENILKKKIVKRKKIKIILCKIFQALDSR